MLISIDFLIFYPVTGIKEKKKTPLCCLLYCIVGSKPEKKDEGLKSSSHLMSSGSIGIIRECLACIQYRAKP